MPRAAVGLPPAQCDPLPAIVATGCETLNPTSRNAGVEQHDQTGGQRQDDPAPRRAAARRSPVSPSSPAMPRARPAPAPAAPATSCSSASRLRSWSARSAPGSRKASGGVIDTAAGRYPKVRAFGEMVALLAHQGLIVEADRLEGCRDRLAEQHRLSLFCAYPIGLFGTEANGRSFRDICDRRRCVLPAESYPAQADATSGCGCWKTCRRMRSASRVMAGCWRATPASSRFSAPRTTGRSWGATSWTSCTRTSTRSCASESRFCAAGSATCRRSSSGWSASTEGASRPR